jgi:hypothetical protein
MHRGRYANICIAALSCHWQHSRAVVQRGRLNVLLDPHLIGPSGRVAVIRLGAKVTPLPKKSGHNLRFMEIAIDLLFVVA